VLGLIADGAGHIHDDGDGLVVNVGFLVDDGDGAEELLNDVGEDGSFLGGDAVLGEKDEEFREGGLHVRGGGEFGEVAEERGSEVDGVGIVRAEGGMLMAVGSGEGSYEETALVTVGVAKGTAGRIFVARLAFLCAGVSGGGLNGSGAREFLVSRGASERGANGFGFHFGPRFLDGSGDTPLPP
jgi:hypothetical protein